MPFSWPSGSRVTASLRLTPPTSSSACGGSRWGCRAPRFERFMWRVCLRPLRQQPLYSLWATSPTGRRQLQRGGGLQACSSLCSSAPLPEVFSWFGRTYMLPSCHSLSPPQRSQLRRSSCGSATDEKERSKQLRPHHKMARQMQYSGRMPNSSEHRIGELMSSDKKLTLRNRLGFI